jgi:polysaccharide deacetylase 2 family uncharacterized protein YibQ
MVANRRKDEKRLICAFIGVLWIFIAVLIYFYPKSAPSKGIVHLEGVSVLNNQVRNALAKNGFSEIQLEKDNGSGLVLAFAIPAPMTSEAALTAIRDIIQRNGCTVQNVNYFSQQRGFMTLIDYYNQPIGTLTFLRSDDYNDYLILKGKLRRKPKLAIVIDDFGYSNSDVIRGFIELNEKITMSVIPGHHYSRWSASEGAKFNKEIIVHMPMEAERSEYNMGEERYIIRHTMRSFEVEQRIFSAINDLPEAVGMNNHMGSLTTADTEVMQMVMNSLKKKGLYFLDSLTSPRSVAYEVAKLNGLSSAYRSVFLDNDKNKSEIQAQFEKAIEIARKRGAAIAIGHVYPETLEVFRQMIETGKFSGISLCFTSEIVS